MECYMSTEIDYEKTAYEKEHVEGMKRTLYSMILEFNYFKLNSDYYLNINNYSHLIQCLKLK